MDIVIEEYEPPCPRCGGQTDWQECENGCDEGYFYPGEDDPIQYDPDEELSCDVCQGQGGWWMCVNSFECCTAEGAKRGTANQARWVVATR